MAMRTGGITSRTAHGNSLALGYGLSLTHQKRLIMAIQGSDSATMVNNDSVAITTNPAGVNNSSAGRCNNRQTVITANIKAAFRAIKTGKDGAFLEKALSTGNTSISRDKLIACAGAENKMEELMTYLSTTSYSSGTKYLSSSPSEFEKWVDDKMISLLIPYKNSPLGPEPMIGFYLGKEAEIKNARIILSAKQNGLPVDVVATRARRLYE